MDSKILSVRISADDYVSLTEKSKEISLSQSEIIRLSVKYLVQNRQEINRLLHEKANEKIQKRKEKQKELDERLIKRHEKQKEAKFSAIAKLSHNLTDEALLIEIRKIRNE